MVILTVSRNLVPMEAAEYIDNNSNAPPEVYSENGDDGDEDDDDEDGEIFTKPACGVRHATQASGAL
jgi:hypothetical protein